MGDVRGFLKHRERQLPSYRSVPERLEDWNEVHQPFDRTTLGVQASRCMDCGIPFCNNGCPLGNIIPDWNDLVYRDQWGAAIERLHSTNNFPEFTGRLCPAPCEQACVLGINQPPVTIKQIEVEIIERAFEEGWIVPHLPKTTTGKRVAVVGSGPAGLAVAQQLTRAGHEVTVFERADRIGGLLRYGIPSFKMEKRILERRLAQMEAEGTEFRVGVEIGKDIAVDALIGSHDAVVLAAGATHWRDLPVPGRELEGVYQAMEYLPWANRAVEGDLEPSETPISAAGKHVVIIGGGDTGADCLGTAHRQGAASVTQFEIMPRPADARTERYPWPTFAMTYKVTSAHAEGGERRYSVSTTEFLSGEGDNSKVKSLRGTEVEFVGGSFKPVEGTEFEIPADLVLLAMGFTGPEPGGLLEQMGAERDSRSNVDRDGDFRTSVDKVFVAGDMGRGQSLIVWAIAEGRSCAAAVDRHLMGSTDLPSPICPTDRPLT